MPYEVRFSKVAFKDVKQLSLRFQNKLKEIITNQIASEPHSGKKLVGDLTGFYSVRLSLKDRIVYTIDEKNKTVYIHRVKTHYGE